MHILQLSQLHKKYDALHVDYGSPDLHAVYGAGCTKQPLLCIIFMNPTARNISTKQERTGLRAPWIGLKQVWKMIYAIGGLSDDLFTKTQTYDQPHWSPTFVQELYDYLSDRGYYLMNLATCTQSDARPLPDRIFQAYRSVALEELGLLQPRTIITCGNQVSSILLQKRISVSSYTDIDHEHMLIEGTNYPVYPCYYPVGLGYRNMPHTIQRIKKILSQNP